MAETITLDPGPVPPLPRANDGDPDRYQALMCFMEGVHEIFREDATVELQLTPECDGDGPELWAIVLAQGTWQTLSDATDYWYDHMSHLSAAALGAWVHMDARAREVAR